MTWIETDSLSFTARHDDADLACAHRVLDSLEELRLRLEDRFDEVPGNVTVILHDNPAWLSMAHPLLPAVRWSAAPAGRRYLAGWPMDGEIHTLNDSWMDRRSAGEDSLRALRGTAERMYCQIVIAANNTALPPMWTPRRFVTYLRWAWLIEGAAQYFAVGARLREIERAWRMHLDEILYPQSESPEGSSPSDALQRPDLNLDLDLETLPEFSFDPTTRRKRTSPPGDRSAEDEIEEIDDQRGDANGRGQAQRESRWRPDAGQ